MKLSELKTGESGIVVKVVGSGNFRKRIIEMGFVRGKKVEVLLNAPLRDPIKYKIMDYEVSLRRSEACLVEIISEEEAEKERSLHDDLPTTVVCKEQIMKHIAREKGNKINVALVGNPNSGKTSLFNLASHSHERVGNYTGITVDAKECSFEWGEYTFNFIDLPGTYSLSAYTPEEIFVRKQLLDATPDIVLNIVSASALERNLYLTTQLIDTDLPMVIALNMYDELEKSGASLDYNQLGSLLGAPIVPTVSTEGYRGDNGLKQLFDTIISVYEGTNKISRHIHINHRGDLQHAIDKITVMIKDADNFSSHISARFFATKYLEDDKIATQYVQGLNNFKLIESYKKAKSAHIQDELQEDIESAIINAKYGFISGALAETFTEGEKENFKSTRIIDKIVTHKLWGYPIFILFMYLTFEFTFVLGAYPQEWIELFINWLASMLSDYMPDGMLKDLLLDGVIQGVGGVLVFLPNILILYFFISLMEDSGYLSRAAFIMDKIMHKMGLHGKSFVPMLMGFGCNVPAIMATRTLESKSSRLITMLVIPFMSCSARLPVFILFTGLFFPKHAALVMLSLYVLGIVVAVITAKLLKKVLFKEEDIPFVMELPPYRVPTLKSAAHHMWEKSKQYLKKMGTLILFASIIIWALGYFPMAGGNVSQKEHLEQSYIGKIGKAIEPAIAPLGFDWRMGVGIISSLPAKELVVSSLSVLFTDSDSTDEDVLGKAIINAKRPDGSLLFSPLTAFGYLVFILLSFPCIATIVAIKNEAGSWKWAAFSAVYSLFFAYVVALAIHCIGKLFG